MLHKQNEAIILPAIAVASALMAAKKIYDFNIHASSKACRNKTGHELEVCVRRAKIKALVAKSNALKAEIGNCDKTDKPERCRKSFTKHIDKIQKQILKINTEKRRMEMDTNKMRLGLIYIFSENKKISKQSKLQLIKFIENANIHQLKVLLMDGEIIASTKLDEQAKKIINDRFVVSESKIIVNKAALEAVNHLREFFEFAGILSTIGAQIVVNKRACLASKCYKKKLLSLDKKICRNQCDQEVSVKAIEQLKAAMSRCEQARNPNKCKDRFVKTIGRHQNRLQQIKAKMMKLKAKH